MIVIGDFSQLPPVKDHILYYQQDSNKSKENNNNAAMHLLALLFLSAPFAQVPQAMLASLMYFVFSDHVTLNNLMKYSLRKKLQHTPQ